MANTQIDIYTKVYNILNEETTSSIFDLTTDVIPLINRIQRRITRGSITNILTKERIKSGDLKFMRKSSFQLLVKPQSLSANVATDDTTISFTTTDFASTGNIIVNDDIISYTGKTSTTITGVSSIGRPHYTSDTVRQLYSLPSDFDYLSEVIDTRNERVLLDYEEMEIPKLDVYYREIADGTTTYLDVVGYNGTKDVVKIVYYKKATDMSATTDTTDLPDDYGLSVLATLVAGELLYEHDEIELGSSILEKGYGALKDMYTFYVEKKKHKRKVRVQPFEPIYTSSF